MPIVEKSFADQEIKHQNEFQLNMPSNLNDGESTAMSKDTHHENEDELTRLRALATDIREQGDLERNVGLQVCHT